MAHAAKSQDSPNNVMEQEGEKLLGQTVDGARASSGGGQNVKNGSFLSNPLCS